MLDLAKLIPQLDGISAGTLGQNLDEQVEKAAFLLADAGSDPERFQTRLETSASTVFWPLARCLEPINCTFAVVEGSADISVAAVDGSQILPSHHEVYNCYLINIGQVAISYGANHDAKMESVPHLFHTVDDLYPAIDRRRFYVDDAFVGLERSLLELSSLRDLALEVKRSASPVVAFADGSLILWSLNQMPETYQRNYISKVNAIYDSLAANKIPLVGYISHSRSAEVINMLRVWQCPYEKSLCAQHCHLLSEEDYPCSTIWPVTDRHLFGNTLSRHNRSPLFLSSHPHATSLSREHHVAFTYINVGTEIARIELPRWTVEDKKLLTLALGAVISQTQKGRGYPVSLAEAHNQAVIHGSDRHRFFELVEQQLIRLGTPSVSVSPKESGKRRGIV